MKKMNKMFHFEDVRFGRIEFLNMPLFPHKSKKKICKTNETNAYIQYKVFNWFLFLYKKYYNNQKRNFDWNLKIYKL